MKQDSLILAQKDIDEALSAIDHMEKTLIEQNSPKDVLKERFIFLSQKIQQLEKILKKEGILE